MAKLTFPLILILLLLVVFFPAPLAKGEQKCMSDMELMADVALEFLYRQEVTARICDPILKPKDKRVEMLMTRIHDEITEKYFPQFTKYQKAQDKRYKRWFGEEWDFKLSLMRKQVQMRILENLELNPGVCQHFRREMEITLNSRWDYLRAKLSYTTQQRRPGSTMCKNPEFELPKMAE